MEIHELVNQVKSKEDLIYFLSQLRNDLNQNNRDWENQTLESYLEAMEAWLTDYSNIPSQPTWKTFADILYASKIYE
ncbi:hypothetical protein D3C71_1985600 [compost metagenome]